MSTIASDHHSKAPQIAIGATFTAAPLEEPLLFWTGELALSHRVVFAPYQQLFQTLLDATGPFASNSGGANVALFRIDDLAAEGAYAEYEQHADELINALITAAGRDRVPLIVCACPESARFLETKERQELVSRICEQFDKRLKNVPNLYLLSPDSIVSRYQVTEVHDPLSDRAGHIPYHPQFYAALATQIVRHISALERKPVKVIAVDCDNTLWSGVCGEDGPEGVRIDSGRVALQRFLKRQKGVGILLAIASKNNEQDVVDTFSLHPDMVLRWGDFAAHRINWESKSKSLLELSETLNLGLDSFVFIDDDAKECAEVIDELPEVVTLRLPAASNEIARFLEHAWVFDHVRPLTAEDLGRSAMYAEQVERSRFEKQAKDLHDFIAGLQLEVVFAPVTGETLPRVSQLTQRTNQMNTTLERYSELELKRALDEGTEAFTVTVSDRFGSYGLVGAALFHVQDDAVVVDSFLLSCRALGRGVEHRVLRHLGEIAIERGKPAIEIATKKGPRNEPVRQLLGGIAPPSKQPFEMGTSLTLDAAYLCGLEYPSKKAVPEPVIAPAQREAKRPGSKQMSDVPFQQIATELNSASRILAAVDRKRRNALEPRTASGATPQGEIQHKLARIWCDLLAIERVGVDEDFFDLGGHSLLAVQLLSRIQRDIGVDLPDSVIYGDKLRIDNLSRTIELHQLGVSDHDAYNSMLAEIESLSDEEVAALLAEEDQRSAI